MSKRKISTQQKFRIKKLQDMRLKRAQKSLEKLESNDENLKLSAEQEGLLIAHHGKYVDVEAADNKIYRCNIRQHLGSMIAGDRVIFQAGKKNTGVVIALQPRTSLLWRPTAREQQKPIAANIDQIIIVFSPQPKPTISLLDSYLVAAEYFQIKPIILLNKVDVLTEADKEILQPLLNIYGNLGYSVLTTSTKRSRGISALKSFLEDHTSIFVGQSGVGKSSLIKALIPFQEISIGDLSKTKGHGAHTTTTSQLYHLPSGGDLIDSPGIREFGLWHLKPEEIAKGHVEFREYLGTCKYRNCLHKDEIGCAILQAVEKEKIAKVRWQSYCAILKMVESK